VTLLSDILLIYPYYRPKFDRSPFRFPPLGTGYIASFLKQHNFEIEIVDGTFRNEKEIVHEVERSKPRIVGIYAMYSMEKESISLAKKIRSMTDLLVVGGPLPTVDPYSFSNDFDIVVIGEAEDTMLEIASNFLDHGEVKQLQGAILNNSTGVKHENKRAPIADLDSIPFPARELFDNDAYKEYYTNRFGYTMTSMISSRGCPFTCDFCSRPVFGDTFRSRSPRNIVDEMEAVSNLGYKTIWFADDCFTISKDRVMKICDEIGRRGLDVDWQCLSRVDTLDSELALRMKKAGCERIYFGIEAGDERILKIMGKDIDLQTARRAVSNANSANIETGAFFIIGYPGDSNETILNTLRFATSLPLDYVSFTLPYPIPGTGLYEKVKHVLIESSEKRIKLIDQHLAFKSEFSEFKLKFAIVKAGVQFRTRKYLGEIGYSILGEPFEKITDSMFRIIK
jgi:anaerobic magnesium-protoporphyrin IX monomethyl ester cyclase